MFTRLFSVQTLYIYQKQKLFMDTIVHQVDGYYGLLFSPLQSKAKNGYATIVVVGTQVGRTEKFSFWCRLYKVYNICTSPSTKRIPKPLRPRGITTVHALGSSVAGKDLTLPVDS